MEGVIWCVFFFFFLFKQKTAYERYQCDWSSDVCSSDLAGPVAAFIEFENALPSALIMFLVLALDITTVIPARTTILPARLNTLSRFIVLPFVMG